MKTIFIAVAAVLLTCATAGTATAQLTGSVEYCITVPSILSIAGPGSSLSLTHDGSDDPQSFAPQVFTVLSNQIDGSTVNFRCVGGFINSANALLFRDCNLGLSLTGSDPGSNWGIDTATDQTDLTATIPDLIAEVTASSDSPGNAVFELSVAMDGGTASILPPGIYCTTIVATVMAN